MTWESTLRDKQKDKIHDRPTLTGIYDYVLFAFYNRIVLCGCKLMTESSDTLAGSSRARVAGTEMGEVESEIKEGNKREQGKVVLFYVSSLALS